MKTSILAAAFLFAFPINAHHAVNNSSENESYSSQKGYAYEETCFRYEYRENYIPGTSTSPGFVKSYQEKVSVPCNSKNATSNHYQNNPKTNAEYVNYVTHKNCNGSTTLGGLIGGGIAASLSKEDAYGWAIPLGAVLGASIGNANCSY
tara:strand:- start:1654 stop:2100 length:447 start_codon:yes stop_codon:yes gene_type:complete